VVANKYLGKTTSRYVDESQKWYISKVCGWSSPRQQVLNRYTDIDLILLNGLGET